MLPKQDEENMKISRPTLLIDKQRALRNIRKMAGKAARSGVIFRPHFKTHQSARIGMWSKKEGINKITVSSIEMARFFADHGWDDITVAFPVNILEIKNINKLIRQVTLQLLVESEETIKFLGKNIISPVGIWIKVDVGYHRTGILWDRQDDILRLIQLINRHDFLNFSGLLTHAGHAYHVQGIPRLRLVYEDSLDKLFKIKKILMSAGVQEVKLSYGDTPTCSIIDNFSGLDEIRPGNFIFYDAMQLLIGSCCEDDIALALACPVVAKHVHRNELIIHGGAVHLSKESVPDQNRQNIYGYATSWNGHHWGPVSRDNYVSSLSQEHGIIRAHSTFFKQIKTGDILTVIPVHSCLCMNLMRRFRVI